MIRQHIIVLTGLALAAQCCIKPYPVYRAKPLPSQGREPSPSRPAPEEPEKNKSIDQGRMMEIINSYMGVPYKYGGATKKGMDCSGFVMMVYMQEPRIKLPHSSSKLFEMGRQVSKRSLTFGDLVFFGKSVSSIDHVGIYTGSGTFAHASTSKGVTISDMSEKYFKRRYRGAVRLTK